jgi:N-acetyl-gamma-glutamyl-phosphate reductase
MTKIAVLGATGYTALELMRILLRHPHAELVALTSRQEDAPHVAEVHPTLRGLLDMRMENLSPEEVASRAELVFCCLPHGASMEAVPVLLSQGARVIDLSADYRLDDTGVYEQWYHQVHTDPTRLGATVYGLPELFADEIRQAELVANPGCYTSTAILALAPFLCGGYFEPEGIIIDAKSGVSGAGRKPSLTTLFPECNEAVSAYAVGQHRHTPEIEQVLSRASRKDVRVTFTPHLIPMDRGIFATIYAKPTRSLTPEQLLEAAREFYRDKPFVRVVEGLTSTKATAHTNFFDLSVRMAGDQPILLATLDNLIKGAAGVAVQNFNLMHGHPETLALW